MPDLATIAGDRDRLADIAHRLVMGVASVRLTAGELAAVRWQLCRELLPHLSNDDRALYPDADADDATADGTPIDAIFQAYVEHWRPETIQADCAGFCADSIRIISAVFGLMKNERCATPSLAPRNRRSL